MVDTALHLGGIAFILSPLSPCTGGCSHLVPFQLGCGVFHTVTLPSLGVKGFHVLSHPFLFHGVHSFNLYIIYFSSDFKYFLHSAVWGFCLLSFFWLLEL